MLSTSGANSRRSGKTLLKLDVIGQQSHWCDEHISLVETDKHVAPASVLWLEHIHRQATKIHTKQNCKPAAIRDRKKVRDKFILLNISDRILCLNVVLELRAILCARIHQQEC